ncbi:helix-turn-helix domain-containing protein [Indiicoccus explosivorum]|uniref:helix-turn-helix domain-containing protein n=1 Tax=Indiicoccus explosivorum TaxID=1917864 RepID=UPI00138FA64E|nr:helix-turn-helix transcriptional regulator [Indiicoccus explosivorum]
MEIHRLLKSTRESLDIPQNEMARRLNVTPSALSRYENGSRTIPLAMLPKLQEAYGLPDHVFLELLTGQKTKLRLQPEQAKELQSAYYRTVFEEAIPLFSDSTFRQFIQRLTELDPPLRKQALRQALDAADKLDGRNGG